MIVNLACGEPDGSQNTFITDAEGNGSIAMTLPPRLDSSDERLSVFGIAYHSDGQTYGDSPGDFGRVTHTQLVAPVPGPMDTHSLGGQHPVSEYPSPM